MEFTENVELEIKGLYLQYLFQDNVLSEYIFTGLNRDIFEMMKITFNEEPNFSGLSPITQNQQLYHLAGDIHIEGLLIKSLYIFQRDKDGYSDCYISAASDGQAAVDTASRLYSDG